MIYKNKLQNKKFQNCNNNQANRNKTMIILIFYVKNLNNNNSNKFNKMILLKSLISCKKTFLRNRNIIEINNKN